MISGVFSTLGGRYACERKLEVLSNNIANAVTPGFKASRVIFSVVPVENPDDLGNTGDVQQTYVNITESYVHFSDAPSVETGNPFDLSIQGNGFFVVSTPTGNRYTRNGQFSLNTEKKLVTNDGSPVMGEGGGDIGIDGKDVKIEPDGSIFVDGTQAGRIKVVDFADRRKLINSGRSLFENTDPNSAEIAASGVAVKQGAYEASNVDVMKEMVDLINTMRAYEAYTKVDQMTGDVFEKLIAMGR
jgi:flagellar basal-body rod protein FlgF